MEAYLTFLWLPARTPQCPSRAWCDHRTVKGSPPRRPPLVKLAHAWVWRAGPPLSQQRASRPHPPSCSGQILAAWPSPLHERSHGMKCLQERPPKWARRRRIASPRSPQSGAPPAGVQRGQGRCCLEERYPFSFLLLHFVETHERCLPRSRHLPGSGTRSNQHRYWPARPSRGASCAWLSRGALFCLILAGCNPLDAHAASSSPLLRPTPLLKFASSSPRCFLPLSRPGASRACSSRRALEIFK